MMRFYRCRWPFYRNRFNYVRIYSALCQPFNVFNQMGFVIKNFNKNTTYDFAFGFWVAHFCQFFQKAFACIDTFHVQTHAFVLFEYIMKFVFAQQSVVDKNTIQILSDGLVQQNGSNRRVHAA